MLRTLSHYVMAGDPDVLAAIAFYQTKGGPASLALEQVVEGTDYSPSLSEELGELSPEAKQWYRRIVKWANSKYGG